MTETVCDPGRVVHDSADRDRLARTPLEICDQVFPSLDADDPLRPELGRRIWDLV